MEGQLNIVLIRAENLRDADIFGLSDPYAVVNVYQCLLTTEKLNEERKLIASFRTLTVENSLNPTWSQSFCIPIGEGKDMLLLDKETRSGAVLEVDIFDEDLGKQDDFLGQIDSPIRNSEPGNSNFDPLIRIKEPRNNFSIH